MECNKSAGCCKLSAWLGISHPYIFYGNFWLSFGNLFLWNFPWEYCFPCGNLFPWNPARFAIEFLVSLILTGFSLVYHSSRNAHDFLMVFHGTFWSCMYTAPNVHTSIQHTHTHTHTLNMIHAQRDAWSSGPKLRYMYQTCKQFRPIHPTY